MRNQTSFRLTTTLLPSDTTAKTTQVINKLDSTGAKFYPTFTEETVVITNDDRTVMETTRATCNNGVLTFVKRGLSDDASATPVENRKLTWNPGSLCFITAGASDWIDKDDDVTWTGDQTYTGDLISTGSATYRGRLVTEKGVEYPHFDSLEDLQDYADPFGGMFAVVDSDGELYRYNDVTDTWSVVTTSTPAQPAQATTGVIGTVRVATDAEFAAGTDQGSNNEYLVVTPSQIQSVSPHLNVYNYGTSTSSISTAGQVASTTFVIAHDGFLVVRFTDYISSSSAQDETTCLSLSASGTASPILLTKEYPTQPITAGRGWSHRWLYAVKKGTATFTLSADFDLPSARSSKLFVDQLIYFGQ